MVRFKSFPRPTFSTMMMSTAACLLVLLAIAFPVQAGLVNIQDSKKPPELFPVEYQQTSKLQDALNKIKGSCPPFGAPEYKYTVTVLGTQSPEIGGCASSIRLNPNEVIPSFNLHLGSLEDGGGSCGSSDMEHYTFECLTKSAYHLDDDDIRGWYVTLYDRTSRWSGYHDYRCALYEVANDEPPTFMMVISGNRSCDGLASRLEETEFVVPEGLRHFADGSVALKFVRDPLPAPLWRKKRAVKSQGGGCRFPDWSQGSWSDLQVDGSMARYDSAFHDKDDVDYDQESDDGKDGDAETTGGDQFMQRSQRQAPVGTSGRNRRSIPYINGVKMYRTQSSTIQNNTRDKSWLKHQLFNDNKRISDVFHSRRERRSMYTVKTKPLLENTDSNFDTLGPLPESVEPTSTIRNEVDITTTLKNDNTDSTKISDSVFDIFELRKKRDLQNQHNDDEEGTKNRKKRCWWESETKPPAPATTYYKTFYFEITTPGPSTPAIDTRNFYVGTSDPTKPDRKKRSLDDDLDNKSKSKEYNEKTDIQKIKILNQFNEIMRWWKSTQTPPMIPHRSQEQSKGDTTEYPFEYLPFEKKSDIKNPSDQGEEVNNKKKRCYCEDVEHLTPINDKDPMKLFRGNEPYFTATSKYTTDLNDKSNAPFDFVQLRNKRDLENFSHLDKKSMENKKRRCYCDGSVGYFTPTSDGDPMKFLRGMEKYFTTTSKDTADSNKISNPLLNQLRKKRDTQMYSEDKEESINHRQKRCHNIFCKFFRKETTTTERYRDVQFENPPKMWDPVEPFAKTIKYFGTTFSPAGPNRDRRSVDEDSDNKSQSMEDDEESFLQKVAVINQIHGFVRWWNIMRAISTTGHHEIPEVNGSNKDPYAVFPENITVPSPVKYFKFAQMNGIPYNESLIKWRSSERANREHEAQIDFLAYPGQNHPDVVMRDFDQTFDGIEYDFNPMYPEGTEDDPTAYRALTLPGGYRLEPRQSRREVFEQKQSRLASESSTVVNHYLDLHLNSNQEPDSSVNYRVPSMEYRRMRRSAPQQNQQQRATTKFTWRCMMPVENDETQEQNLKTGTKFLTYGGRIVNKNVLADNDQLNEQELDALVDIKEDSKMSYGCMSLAPRGPNILEFSIIGTGMPEKNQDLQSFARQLCSENKTTGRDSNVRNQKRLRPRRLWWVTETRTDDSKRVPVGCPVPPGIVFYGVVPAPPPPSQAPTSQPEPMRLCARLVSSADDCKNGQMGPADQMKYTVSECVEENAPPSAEPKMIFEASRGYTAGGSWRRNKRQSAPTDTSTVASSVATSTSSNMPILPSSGHSPSTRVIDNITNHQTTGSTATFSTSTTPSSTISSSNGSQHFVDITTIDPIILVTTTTTPTTPTAFSTATSSTLPLSSPQDTTSPDRQLSPISMSSTTTTPSTLTATVTTASSYYQGTDYHNRQQQQWQQQPQQPNNNNNDYYYRGRQQNYPPPPPGSTGMDYNYYYRQRQQQLWQQQQPQTQSNWSPQQHPTTAHDYSNSYQPQPTDSSGHRTGDYYYRQQQQNYHNHQYNNDRQQQTPQPRNSSLMLNQPNGGSWNVHGDRPLYISSGGGGDSNRDAPVAWNSSTSIGSSNNGGWSTVEQQHWWYQQQQQRQQQQQQQQLLQQQQLQQQQQQQQQQHRQQQNNRGLGGILSLPPVPLPPLHVEQGPVTVSIPTPLPLHPRRPQKPSNHYYLPTLTTKTFSQLHQLRPKSESRYYEEREYQCLGQWTEAQQQLSPVAGEKPIMLTYTYVKRLNPISKSGSLYECFVGTPIPNDEGVNPETTTTLLLTEAGTGSRCSRLADPYRSGMKLVGTKIPGACKGSAQPGQDASGGSWYSMKPQPISPSVPGAENGGGTWYAAPPVPVVAQSPATMMPILTGRHTGGNGPTFISRQNEHRSGTSPPNTNHSFQTVADMRVVLLLAGMLLTGHVNNIINYRFTN